jgi:hypothetical protein
MSANARKRLPGWPAIRAGLFGATPEIRKGEAGCLFDEIRNLVEPAERLHMSKPRCGERPDKDIWASLRTKLGEAVQAGPQRGRTPERCGRARSLNSPVPGEHKDV